MLPDDDPGYDDVATCESLSTRDIQLAAFIIAITYGEWLEIILSIMRGLVMALRSSQVAGEF